MRDDNYYRSYRDRGMRHGEALKTVVRKRLKVIYAIMRDKVPTRPSPPSLHRKAQRPWV